MVKKRLKVYHFFISWIFTLLVGLLVGCIIDVSVGLITTVLAALSSLPFILLFLLLQYFYLKKLPSKSQLHARTFLMHFIGSVLVFLGFIVAERHLGDDAFALLGVMLAYFVVDSIFFHAFIQTKHHDAPQKIHPEVLDILD